VRSADPAVGPRQTPEVVLKIVQTRRLQAPSGAARPRAGTVPGMTDFERFAATIGLPVEPFQRRITAAITGPEREVVISTFGGSEATPSASTRQAAYTSAIRSAWTWVTVGRAERAGGA
jgi:hypothetical protein